MELYLISQYSSLQINLKNYINSFETIMLQFLKA